MAEDTDVTGNGESILAAALKYLQRDWSVIPMLPKSKKPARTWGAYQKQRATEREVRSWFDGTDCNVAIIPGWVSGGLAIRDFDDDGAYHRWAAAHPDKAESLPTVRTGRGFHVYHRISDHIRVEIYSTVPVSLQNLCAAARTGARGVKKGWCRQEGW